MVSARSEGKRVKHTFMQRMDGVLNAPLVYINAGTCERLEDLRFGQGR
jgi:hypothetical protein